MNMFSSKDKERGFTLIEMIFAILILTVGIMTLVSVLTANIIRSFESERRIVAKQMAVSTLESIIALKERKKQGAVVIWDTLKAKSVSPPTGTVNGIFLTDWNPIRVEFGPDGVAGTDDDACAGTGGCTGNSSSIVEGYDRKIVITDLEDPDRPMADYGVFRKKVEVSVRFSSNQAVREEKISTIITNY